MIAALLVSLLGLLPGNQSLGNSDAVVRIPSDSLTVYVFLLDECLISQFYTPELSRLNEKYEGKGIGFIGYFPNSSTSAEEVKIFAQNYHIDFPLETDHNQDFVKKFEINVTPEVAVWDHRDNRLLYRGRIDDSYVRVGKRKLHPQNRDLENIIQAWIDMKSSDKLIETQAIGCFINFDNSGH